MEDVANLPNAGGRDSNGMAFVAKPDHFRKLGPVSISALLPTVSRISEQAWETENRDKENDFPVLGATQHMIFRFTPGNLDPRKVYSSTNWTMWKSRLLPVINEAMAYYDHREAPE